MRSLAFRAALAFAAGAAAVLAFSPFDLWPAGLAAHALLVHLWLPAGSPRAALLLGYAFGLGLFLTGVSWVYISLHRFGAMPAPLAALATFGFCAWLAIFPALTGWLQAKLRAGAAVRAALAIPALWTIAEWIRGWHLTGFPWLGAGYAALDTPLAGFAPLARPDVSAALQKTGGRLFPFGWLTLLLELRRTDWININGAALLPEYRGSGGTAILYSEMFKSVTENPRYRHVDVVQVGVENDKMQRELENFGIDFYKMHRVYRKSL